MTRVEFKNILSREEYNSLGRFLSTYMHPIGEKMVNIPCDNDRYKSLLVSVNVYDNKELVDTAMKRIAVARAMPLRVRTLRKVIDYIKNKEKDKWESLIGKKQNIPASV